jgi:hypothetical protein
MKRRKYTLCLILIIFIFGVYGASCKQDDGPQKGGEPKNMQSKHTEADAEDDLEKRIEENKHFQEERKKIIDGMLEGGLASRIENPNGEPFIYVMQPFYLLTLDEQAALMNSVWYYFITQDRSVDVLTIYDEDTGNEIGTFGRKGLLMGE